MHLPQDFEVKVLGVGEKVEMEPKDYVTQLKPTKLFVLPHGATDNTPSFFWELTDLYGRKFVAQISQTMLVEGLARAEQLRSLYELVQAARQD